MEFTVYGEPIGKQRARVVLRGSKVSSFTPSKTKNYEKLIRDTFIVNRFDSFGDKPLKITIKAFYPIPQSNTKKMKESKLRGLILPCVKPDIDNVSKSVLDALNEVAFNDDKQVIELAVMKKYSNTPRLEIKVEEAGLWE